METLLCRRAARRLSPSFNMQKRNRCLGRRTRMAASRGIMALALTIGLMPCVPAYAEETGLAAVSPEASSAVSHGANTNGRGFFATSDEEGESYAEGHRIRLRKAR